MNRKTKIKVARKLSKAYNDIKGANASSLRVRDWVEIGYLDTNSDILLQIIEVLTSAILQETYLKSEFERIKREGRK